MYKINIQALVIIACHRTDTKKGNVNFWGQVVQATDQQVGGQGILFIVKGRSGKLFASK